MNHSKSKDADDKLALPHCSFESGDLLECYSLAGEYPRRGEKGEDTPLPALLK